MHQLFSIGYSLISIIAFFLMVWGSPRFLESIYSLSLQYDETKNARAMFPKSRDITSGIWVLDFPDLQEKLPDLRQEVIFLGSNNRPDAFGGKFFLELASSKDRYVACANEKVYLQALPPDQGGGFIFSPKGQPTDLWLECRPLNADNRIEVKVRLLGVNKEMIVLPKERETLLLSTLSRGLESWEIGGIRVDASFPVKQKMRRVGVDKFLLMHGGAAYADIANKERVDFVSLSNENYSRYLAVGDILLWDGNCWQTCGAFQGDSSQVPLLEVKKVDEKTMLIEIWNVGGTAHQAFNLVKIASSPMEIAEILKEFEFVGMRSWSRPIIHANGQRLILSPDDWVIHSDTGWEKIVRKEQLEAYLSGRIYGPLLIFDKLEKDSRGFVFRAHMFNAQRTLVETVTLPLKQGFDCVAGTGAKEEVSLTKPLLSNGEGTNRNGGA
ncbi:hypothetical protein [Chlamydia avium]|uniref:Uncharacterized protein n=1 Tax=Chlamydia avium 10DC88 TaxID=1229831 RepID=W8JRW7_9CHLA|nr:hypothetical protein [Chlamydia avium]AHK63583.1 Uncharacterized protein M832_07320 [Chlamydia avium 10DC88]